ncbi:LOW QUALITY PROTEIN: myotubularin-related protein 14 [Pristis pectinata]|uniref:LOW QUALITY PROTEIN: myotubularin-related protein 14 n=1 Tax=Pristis pectinata TaxID=685728 RepID=UPI00223DEB0B|nr:LOW QUALITY PROTEIN: myotubularin-related protein 14 [Pristis pectinata]
MWQAGLAGPGVASRSEEIGELIEHFSKHQYRAKEANPKVEKIESRCLELFRRDYVYSVIQNPNGELCGHYPRRIIFIEYASTEGGKDRNRFESTVQTSKLQDFVSRSKMARCRGRFVCPVIMYQGKHICRSATLAGWGELYGRSGYNYLFSGGSDDAGAESDEVPDDYAVRNGDSQLFDKVRGHDIKLLRYLSVRYICDLMVEKKKVKFGLNVTSSEKVDKAKRYADFTLLSIPYPGCEFFKDYKDRDYTAEGLVFNWNQDFVDAPLNIPPSLTENLNIDWRDYQSWDLVQQTQNYLKLLIHIINRDEDSGLLVHCISGWDRTPLFISLLRLSLWADGLVHACLEPVEILYLTIAYDWFLFGHMLSDRLSKGEEIFFFCFNFLKHITSEEFSVAKKLRRKNTHKEAEFPVDDLCILARTDRGSTTSLGSDFSVIMEESPTTAGSFNYEAVELTAGPPTQVLGNFYECKQHLFEMQYTKEVVCPPFFDFYSHLSWKSNNIALCAALLNATFLLLQLQSITSNTRRRGRTSSPQTVMWNKPHLPNQAEDRFLQPGVSEPRPSFCQSENNFLRTGSSPLAVPERSSTEYSLSSSSSTEYGSWQIVSGCGSIHDPAIVTNDSPLPFNVQDDGANGRLHPLIPERRAKLEEVRAIFLSAYSATVGLRSISSSPSAIGGLLEQFARGVGLRGTNSIV